MSRLFKIFTEHPASVGETYFQHMAMAFGFGTKMVIGGLACLVHGLFPFLCLKTGSKAVDELHTTMVTHRNKQPLIQNSSPPSTANTAK